MCASQCQGGPSPSEQKGGDKGSGQGAREDSGWGAPALTTGSVAAPLGREGPTCRRRTSSRRRWWSQSTSATRRPWAPSSTTCATGRTPTGCGAGPPGGVSGPCPGLRTTAAPSRAWPGAGDPRSDSSELRSQWHWQPVLTEHLLRAMHHFILYVLKKSKLSSSLSLLLPLLKVRKLRRREVNQHL